MKEKQNKKTGTKPLIENRNFQCNPIQKNFIEAVLDD